MRLTQVFRPAMPVLAVTVISLAMASAVQAQLVSHWALDTGTGTTVVDSTGPNPGAFAGGGANPTWTTSAKLGPYALDFDGGDFASMPSSASLNVSTAITLSTWVQRDGGLGNRQIFIGKGDGNSDASTQYWLEFTAGNALVFYASNGSGHYVGNSVITDNNWHHIVGTQNGATQSIYIDGVLNQSANWSTPLTNTAFQFAIGQMGTIAGLRLDGKKWTTWDCGAMP